MIVKMHRYSLDFLGRMLLPVLAAGAILAAAAPAAAQSKQTAAPSRGGSDSDASAIELLRAIEQRHGQVQTVTGQYEQTREVADSPEAPKKSVALFYLEKPNKFRADYLNPGEQPAQQGYPYRSTNLIVGRDSYQYVRELDQINHYRFRDDRNVRDFNYLLLGFGAHTDDVLKVYAVKSMKRTPKGYRGVELIPHDPADAGFEAITMMVTDDDQLLPAEFSLIQADKSRQKVRLHLPSLKIGGRVDKSTFRQNFPSSAEPISLN